VTLASLLASGSAKSDGEYFNGKIPVWVWVLLGGLIVAMLAIDLIRHDDEHEPTAKEALKESLVWVGVSLAFGVFVLFQFNGLAFGEYMSGYVLEKSLSVDNVFVWALIFGSFKIPLRYQHRVLFWGIFGALAFRAIFIVLGKTLIDRFAWTLVLFGLFLGYTGIKILMHREDEEEEEAKQSGLGLLRKIMPVTERYDGKKFFTLENGKRAATPLFACLVVVEFTDIVFAVDSVPAILAVAPKSNFIVFASNAFAILGLRAMYFLLADAKERFHYLSTALGVILIFVGAKMVATFWDKHIPDVGPIKGTYISLMVIMTILAIGIFASLKLAPKPESHSAGQAADTDKNKESIDL
jgi:tellurite resistance protein TerC